ncbi:MAG: ATP-dependent Clp protease proteolytic subunit [Clostridia bacterium]|nr:ATP-dependent Clp protease proteolytic subunit [Clostridia bacterium]
MQEQPLEAPQASPPPPTDPGGITVQSGQLHIRCLTIIGQIEGHYLLPPQNKTTKYEHMLPQLVEVEESPHLDALLLLLNTAGGDVEAGLAMAELIAGMSKPTVSLVLGGGHSIGVPLAVCTNRSFIVPSATMTLHPVRTSGLVVGVEQSFTCLEQMQQRINRFITRHSRISEDTLHSLMFRVGELVTDVGSVIDGPEAVNSGLIDSIGGLSDALSFLHRACGK